MASVCLARRGRCLSRKLLIETVLCLSFIWTNHYIIQTSCTACFLLSDSSATIKQNCFQIILWPHYEQSGLQGAGGRLQGRRGRVHSGQRNKIGISHPLISREWSCDLSTGLWWVDSDHMTWILASDWSLVSMDSETCLWLVISSLLILWSRWGRGLTRLTPE